MARKNDIEELWYQQYGELMCLSSILKNICSRTMPYKEFYSKLLCELDKVIPVRFALVMARPGPKTDIQIKHIFPEGKPLDSKMEAEKYLARWAYQIKESILLNNKLIDIKIMDPFSSDLEPSTNSYLFSPVIHKGEVLSVIALIDKKKNIFNLKDKFLLEAVCCAAALFEATND